MPSPPLDNSNGRTTSGVESHHRLWNSSHYRTASAVACHHCPWATHAVERSRAWHDITAFGQHTRSNDIRHDMPSQPMDSTHGRRTQLMACHHHLWAAQTVERRRAWHAIIALRPHTQSKDVGRGITSPPLDSTHGRQRRAWHAIITFRKHTRSNDVGRAIPTSPLDSTNGRTTSSEASHHRP